MVTDMRESLKMIKDMDKAYSINQKTADMRESSLITKNMDRAYFINQMATLYMRESSNIIKSAWTGHIQY